MQAKRDGLRRHATVYTSGNNIDFRFDHKQAQRPRTLVLRSESVEPPTTTTDPMDQLRKLSDLRDAGLLTIEEFAAKKASVLER